MSDEINYHNNPLHGLGLKELLTEIVDHYGFEILFAYLNINCFKTNPSIESSIKFLKKTTWAREKVEAFYMYQYKNLPRASQEQFELPPRDRIVPDHQTPGEPAELSLEDAERLREKRARKAAERDQRGRNSRGRSDSPYGKRSNDNNRNKPWGDKPKSDKDRPRYKTNNSESNKPDPWANWKKNNDE